VQPDGNGYKGFLDPEQRAWFEAELASTPAGTPVCVVSHIPIIAVTAITYGKPPARGQDTILSGGEMHTDCAELHELMRASGKVRLCLSGHIHLRDRCETDGITYINDGAVSGSWWKGPLEGVPEGFGVIDLRPDGTFDHRYETYGWTAQG
jgi:3',5'-cyclic AMP phosphodiesterase CpdA